MLIEMLAAWRLVDSERFVFSALLMPAGVVFRCGVRVLRLVLGLVVGSHTRYLPFSLVAASDYDAFWLILDGHVGGTLS